MFDKQEVFDYVVKSLAKQGGPSIYNPEDHYTGNCVYRGSDDRKCGIGHLIDDKHYTVTLEGHDVTEVVVWEVLKKSAVINLPGIERPIDLTFFLRLQRCHDTAIHSNNKWIDVWKLPDLGLGGIASNFKEMGQLYNLNLDVLYRHFPE